jgi:hypothetical protein
LCFIGNFLPSESPVTGKSSKPFADHWNNSELCNDWNLIGLKRFERSEAVERLERLELATG